MKEEMGVDGIEIKPLIKFRMKYGINDNEISVLYEGVVDPAEVRFDPVEIESLQYASMHELKKMMKIEETNFCGWLATRGNSCSAGNCGGLT